MWKKSLLVGMGLLAASLWGVPASSQPHFGGRHLMMSPPLGDGPGMMLPLLLKGVDLTPEQEAKVHSIMTAHHATFRTLFTQLRAAHEEMADKLFAPGAVTTEDLAPQTQRMTQLRDQLMRDGLNVMLEIRTLLTPEQLAKAAQLKTRMQALQSEMRSLLHEQKSGAKPDDPMEDEVFFSPAP